MADMALAACDGSGRARQLSVLVVDDDPEMVDLVTTALEQADGDIETTGVTDPESGLSAIESTAFDGVISDYHMPRMDGITFLARVRECASTTQRILFTSDDDASVRERAENAGLTFMHKPRWITQLDEMLDRIDHDASP
jgi:CheY-like chemotaxis protein